jgi:hypothetical protein
MHIHTYTLWPQFRESKQIRIWRFTFSNIWSLINFNPWKTAKTNIRKYHHRWRHVFLSTRIIVDSNYRRLELLLTQIIIDSNYCQLELLLTWIIVDSNYRRLEFLSTQIIVGSNFRRPKTRRPYNYDCTYGKIGWRSFTNVCRRTTIFRSMIFRSKIFCLLDDILFDNLS